jgi:hypothetical protein
LTQEEWGIIIAIAIIISAFPVFWYVLFSWGWPWALIPAVGMLLLSITIFLGSKTESHFSVDY